MAKEIKYNLHKVIGTIGDPNGLHKTVELGHYTVDGEEKEERVYIFDHYFKRDGSLGSSSAGKLMLEEFNALKAMEI